MEREDCLDVKSFSVKCSGASGCLYTNSEADLGQGTGAENQYLCLSLLSEASGM